VNLTECEIRSVLFGPYGRVEEWNLTNALFGVKTRGFYGIANNRAIISRIR
jgi:hypothetical protein